MTSNNHSSHASNSCLNCHGAASLPVNVCSCNGSGIGPLHTIIAGEMIASADYDLPLKVMTRIHAMKNHRTLTNSSMIYLMDLVDVESAMTFIARRHGLELPKEYSAGYAGLTNGGAQYAEEFEELFKR